MQNKESISDALTEMLLKGAQELIRNAIEAELNGFIAEQQSMNDDRKVNIIRNGYQPERVIQTGIGPVKVKVPKVRSKEGKAITFRSALVPPYVIKFKSLEAELPELYLKCIAIGDMGDAQIMGYYSHQ